MIFYRNLLKAALELDPNQTMRAITEVVKTFQMPGSDIPGFQRKAVEMAIDGIYDLRQHRDEVVMPVLRFWKVFDSKASRRRRGGAPRAPAILDGLEVQAGKFEQRRDRLKARMAARRA